MTSIIRILLILLIVSQTPLSAFAGALTLSRDAEGWTVFVPTSNDTRIMYVSSGGTDPGTVYTSANHPDWSNPFNPTGTINAYATYAAAAANLRADHPDWILFKRGETFTLTGQYPIAPTNGKDEDEPMLFGAYGASGSSPVLKTSASTEQAVRLVRDLSHDASWVAFSGLDFYSSVRDPLSADYLESGTAANAIGINITGDGTSVPEYHNGILIEGCKFRMFYAGISVQTTVPCSGLTIRRNVVLDSYNRTGDGHAKGIWLYKQSLTLEDNILDHNGWYSQAGSGGVGEATILQHNMYFNNLNDAVIRNNISMRSSSIGLKVTGSVGAASIDNLTIDNNLFYDNEIGVQLEDNYHTDAGGVDYRVRNCTLRDNVITDMGKSRPTNRTLGWGLQLASWDGGLVSNNLVMHQNESVVNNNYGMTFYDLSKNVAITNNVFHGLRYSQGLFINLSYGASASTGMVFSGNKIQIPADSYYTIDSYYDPAAGWTFSDNIYYSNKTDGTQFRQVYIDEMTFNEWKAATGDTSTFSQYTFPDSTRTIASYMTSIGETGTEAAFIAKCRAQDRYSWDTECSADAVNDYLRAGFGMSEYTPPGQSRHLFRNFRIGEVEP